MDRFLEATVLELLHQSAGTAVVSREAIDAMVRIFIKVFVDIFSQATRNSLIAERQKLNIFDMSASIKRYCKSFEDFASYVKSVNGPAVGPQEIAQATNSQNQVFSFLAESSSSGSALPKSYTYKHSAVHARINTDSEKILDLKSEQHHSAEQSLFFLLEKTSRLVPKMVFNELGQIDELLSCPICHEMITNAVILSCGHSFCSVCLRRYLSFKLECPQCRKEVSPLEIVPNRILNELRPLLSIMREKILALQSVPKDDIVIDESVDTMKCPMCQKSFPLTDVEIHASFCKGGQEKLRRTPMKPLPKPIYHLLKDAQIRAKLLELGLKTTGDRNSLIRRHSEYVLLHNAELDAERPKSASQLRQALDRVERAWNREK